MLQVYQETATMSVAQPVLQGYREIAEAIGSEDIIPTIDAAVRRIDGVARWYFYEWAKVDNAAAVRCRTHALAFRHEDGVEEMVGTYASRFVYSDPLNEILEAASPESAAFALSLAPSDIPDTLYRERYMRDADIQQRMSFVHRSGSNFLVMNVSRNCSHGDLDDRAIEQFSAFSMLVFPLLARHLELKGGGAVRHSVNLSDIELIVSRVFPQLTRREGQVAARTVVGRSSKAIAKELDISQETVLTYRKRIYLRTDCNSIEQLAKAVIN